MFVSPLFSVALLYFHYTFFLFFFSLFSRSVSSWFETPLLLSFLPFHIFEKSKVFIYICKLRFCRIVALATKKKKTEKSRQHRFSFSGSLHFLFFFLSGSFFLHWNNNGFFSSSVSFYTTLASVFFFFFFFFFSLPSLPFSSVSITILFYQIHILISRRSSFCSLAPRLEFFSFFSFSLSDTDKFDRHVSCTGLSYLD